MIKKRAKDTTNLKEDEVTLCAVGDVCAFHQDPEAAFEYVGPILRKADITFGHNERHYSDRKDFTPRGGFTELTTLANARALKLGSFDVMSFATNHSMDLGTEAMLQTADFLKKELGIAVIGVGKNLEEARKPAIIERKGVRIAFLAYASVLQARDNATPQRAGVAPLRAWTHYHQLDYQPGTPPQILTFAYKQDLDALLEDVKKAKARADLVALSFHWGIHFLHAAIAMYQNDAAHAAIDTGADIILGHHPHILKGIEVYKGKPIFYSMGNFQEDVNQEAVSKYMKPDPDVYVPLGLYGTKHFSGWPRYNYPPESRKSMIVKCVIVDKKIQKVSFQPVLINREAQPKPVAGNDKNFNKFLRYMKEINKSQGLSTELNIEGDEIAVSLA